MSIYRKAAKRDANEGEIVAALRKAGATVYEVSGRGVPDLLVWFRGWYAIEVKMPKGRLTDDQNWDETIEPGAVPIVRTPEEALKAIGAVQ